IEAGEDVVVGVNRFTTTEPSPLTENLETSIQTVDPATEAAQIESVCAWRAARDPEPAEAALSALRDGVTTGEWAGALREVFGEYRAPTGVSASAGIAAGGTGGTAGEQIAKVRQLVSRTGEELGRRLKILVGKPGLDGHSNGAEQIAVRARDVGFEVIYQGIRLTPAQIVSAAAQEGVHVVGLSILSGSHMEVVPAVVDGLRAAGVDDVPVVVGGIIPPEDAEALRARGVAKVFTPKDFELTA